MKKQVKVITTAQFHSRISHTTNTFSQTALGATTQVEAYKTIFEMFNTVKEHVPEDVLIATSGMITQVNAVIEQVVVALEKVKAEVSAPPTFYPYSTERLDMWEMGIATTMMEEILNRFEVVVEAITILGGVVDDVNKAMNGTAEEPAEKVVEAEGAE